MATGTDIKTLAASYCDAGTSISDANAILWINECLLKLGMDCRVAANGNIIAADSATWYDLPTDLGAITSIYMSSGKEFGGSYQIRQRKIRFDRADTFTLYYWKKPSKITAIGNTIPVDELLESAVALYVASRYKSQDDDENPDARRLMAEFDQSRLRAIDLIDNPVQPPVGQIKPVYGDFLSSSPGGSGPFDW